MTSHEVHVHVQLSFRVPVKQDKPDTTSKKPRKLAAKSKIENKNKEFDFTFERADDNYLSFLSTLLDKHGLEKYTPIVKQRRFGIKVGLAGKKVYVRHCYQLIN